MTIDSPQNPSEGWGPAIGHVFKRLLLMVAGYAVALLIGLFAVSVIYGILGSLPNAPSYYVAFELAPMAIIFLPGLALLAILIAFIVTVAQSLIAGVLAEIFRLRNFALHMLFGALIAASGFALIMPTEQTSIPEATSTEMIVMAVAGAIAGFVYWMIAGREAGFKRDRT